MTIHLTKEQTEALSKTLKRCSPETLKAVLRFRNNQDHQSLPIIVYGIIERFLPASSKIRLIDADGDTRLMEDLGLDSLTMLEIVLTIEECLGIHIENEELKHIRTIGLLKSFLAGKINGVKSISSIRKLTREHIALVLPQQPPFLFLDEAELDGDIIRASYCIKGNEWFFEGHFKDNPIMPASIVFEALGQAACLWILETVPKRLSLQLNPNEVLFATMESAHFYQKAKPGDKLEIEQKLIKLRTPLAIFKGTVKVNGKKLALVEEMALAFSQNSSKIPSEDVSIDVKHPITSSVAITV